MDHERTCKVENLMTRSSARIFHVHVWWVDFGQLTDFLHLATQMLPSLQQGRGRKSDGKAPGLR